MTTPARHILLTLLSLWSLLSWPALAQEQEAREPGLRILSTETRVVDGVVRLDAAFDLKLSDELIEAIHNGVPITLNIEMEVWRERSYWPDDEIARVVQRYTFTYNELTRSYRLDNLNSGTHYNLPSLDAALWVASALSDFPFLDVSLLEPGERYYYRMRLGIDVESLPVPLRAMALIFSRWHLTGEWRRWPLQP